MLTQVTSLYRGEEFVTLSKFSIGNRFHVTRRIVNPTTFFKKNHSIPLFFGKKFIGTFFTVLGFIVP